MLTKYIQEAMRRAHYELMEDGEFWGEIEAFEGLWGGGRTLEECREDLQGALEGWLLLKLWDHDDDIPVLGRLSLYPRKAALSKAVAAANSPRTRRAS
jgi:predicted RNase H-like HicB family nuclease